MKLPQEEGVKVTRSICWSAPGCHGGCGLLLHVRDGRLVRVEGNPEDPHNQGRLCVRALSIPKVLNHPDRLRHPIRRAGARSEGKWERVSWEEAYDHIFEELTRIKESWGAESVVFFHGTGRDVIAYESRLAYSFGSPNVAAPLAGNACYLPKMASMKIITGDFAVADCSQGFPDRYENPAWTRPECLLIWGNDPVRTNPDGFFGHWVTDCLRRGTKLITVDPRLTHTAARSELWLQLRPATDAALALGLLNVIIEEGLFEEALVERWTHGFERLRERAREYPPERVAEITWVPAQMIAEAARLYARSKPAAIQWGLGTDMAKECMGTLHALQCLWTITGNLDVPGGNMIVKPPLGVSQPWGGGWGFEELLSPEQQAKRIGAREFPMYGKPRVYAQPDRTIEQMLTGEPYPIKGAWIQTTNPIACMAADPRRIYEALLKLDFIVGVDLFMTPTLQAVADIVLPAAGAAERDGVRALWYCVAAINKAAEPGECKSDMEICLEMGRRFNSSAWPWGTVQEMFDHIVSPTGLTFKELSERGWVYPRFEYRKYEKGLLREDGKPGFNTPTGKVELYSTLCEGWGHEALPYYEEPEESPIGNPELAREYPLILITGVPKSWAFFHSEQRQVAQLREIHPDPLVELHPETARGLGISDGDWVYIENQRGRCRQRARVTSIIHPRVVAAQHGWWFPEREGSAPELYGVWESNINLLVPMQYGRSGYGAPYRALLCKVYKA
ncbi:MAG: molybdopterin-dependent oxidoreductase [Nitrospinota bacterium]